MSAATGTFSRLDFVTIALARGIAAPECLPVEELAECAGAALRRDGHYPTTQQVVAGPMQYHGSDGYETDVIDPDRGQSLPDMGRSTGFIHVGCGRS